jgi:hypothetical protein
MQTVGVLGIRRQNVPVQSPSFTKQTGFVIAKCLGVYSVAHRLAPLAFGIRNCRCLKGIS